METAKEDSRQRRIRIQINMIQRQNIPRKISRTVLQRRDTRNLLISVVEEEGLLVIPDRQGRSAEEERGESG
jgi:hypothetical protein